jgi:hypothetical protein
MALLAKDFAERPADLLVVVDDEDAIPLQH